MVQPAQIERQETGRSSQGLVESLLYREVERERYREGERERYREEERETYR